MDLRNQNLNLTVYIYSNRKKCYLLFISNTMLNLTCLNVGMQRRDVEY